MYAELYLLSVDNSIHIILVSYDIEDTLSRSQNIKASHFDQVPYQYVFDVRESFVPCLESFSSFSEQQNKHSIYTSMFRASPLLSTHAVASSWQVDTGFHIMMRKPKYSLVGVPICFHNDKWNIYLEVGSDISFTSGNTYTLFR